MDAGPSFDAFSRRRSSHQYGDRFIPNRRAMRTRAYNLPGGGEEDKEEILFEHQAAYREALAKALGLDTRRMLRFRNVFEPLHQENFIRCPPRRNIPQHPRRSLDAPGVMGHSCYHVMDWGCQDALALGIGDTVYMWDAVRGSDSELFTVDEGTGPVTSVRWAPDGRRLAVGLNNSHILLWDIDAGAQVRVWEEGHTKAVGSLDWNGQILTSGGLDGSILNHDTRSKQHAVGSYRGHRTEVCGLKWSESGNQLASGGNDKLVYIWSNSNSMSSRWTENRWVHKLAGHTGSVRALSWCRSESHLLATGGNDSDQFIKFWDTSSGKCLNSVKTGSSVCSLIWREHQREILSGHGSDTNHLILWKYPNMHKIVELYHHTSSVLYTAENPGGDKIASLAGDEVLNFWKVMETPAKSKKSPEREPFFKVACIR